MNKETNKSITADPEVGGVKKAKAGAFKVLLRIFMQAFTMTFVAEWGDRSQITTIILSARENLMGVITGGVIGHAICTGIGVVGGRMIAQKISVRTGKLCLIDLHEARLISILLSYVNWRRCLHSIRHYIFNLGSQLWRHTTRS